MLSTHAGNSAFSKFDLCGVIHARCFDLLDLDVGRLRRSAAGNSSGAAPHDVLMSMPMDDSFMNPCPVTVSVPPLCVPGGCGNIGCRSCAYGNHPLYRCCGLAEPIGPTMCPAYSWGYRPACYFYPDTACCSIRTTTPCTTITGNNSRFPGTIRAARVPRCRCENSALTRQFLHGNRFLNGFLRCRVSMSSIVRTEIFARKLFLRRTAGFLALNQKINFVCAPHA